MPPHWSNLTVTEQLSKHLASAKKDFILTDMQVAYFGRSGNATAASKYAARKAALERVIVALETMIPAISDPTDHANIVRPTDLADECLGINFFAVVPYVPPPVRPDARNTFHATNKSHTQ